MENKTKDSQIHATGGSVKKLLNTHTHSATHPPTHAHTHARTHTNSTLICTHTLRWWHTKSDSWVHTYTNKHTYMEHTNQHMHEYIDKYNRPEASFENLRFFLPYPSLQ